LAKSINDAIEAAETFQSGERLTLSPLTPETAQYCSIAMNTKTYRSSPVSNETSKTRAPKAAWCVAAVLLLLVAGNVIAAQSVPVTATPAARATTPAKPNPLLDADAVWVGKVQIAENPDSFLDCSVKFTGSLAERAGTISIPAQNAKDLKLMRLSVHDKGMAFTLLPPGAPEATAAVFALTTNENDRTFASGTMTQNGRAFPITLQLLPEGQQADIGPKRPQTPKAPLPYRTSEVTITSGEGDAAAKLTGTLVLPDEAKFPPPYPAVVFITGSGPQDRDETLFDHKPFAVLADALAKAGIASLRTDDRGVGGSTSTKASSGPGSDTTDDFAADALANVAFCAQDKNIDANRIGLLGHSEGALVAAIAAASAPKAVGFIVMMAGQGTNGGEVLKQQTRALAMAGGAPMEYVKTVSALHAELVALISGKDEAKIREAMDALALAQMGIKSLEDLRLKQRESLVAMLDQQTKAMLSPWMQRWIVLEPTEYFAKLSCPVMVLQGGIDRQVVAEDNLPPTVAALARAGNTDVTVRLIPGLNHLLQKATTGVPAEYASIEQTMDEGAIDAVVTWVGRVGSAGRAGK